MNCIQITVDSNKVLLHWKKMKEQFLSCNTKLFDAAVNSLIVESLVCLSSRTIMIQHIKKIVAYNVYFFQTFPCTDPCSFLQRDNKLETIIRKLRT